MSDHPHHSESRIGNTAFINGEAMEVVVVRLDERTQRMDAKIDTLSDAILGPDAEQHKGLVHRVRTLEEKERGRERQAKKVSNLAWGAIIAAVAAVFKSIYSWAAAHFHWG